MREIMFRCIDKTNPDLGPFHGGFAVHATGKIVENIEAFNGKTENLIVMQYTGLKDKNGKDIYEGDILKVESEITTEILKVIYHMGNACYAFPKCDAGHPIFPTLLGQLKEVIGNIYQNPELLK